MDCARRTPDRQRHAPAGPQHAACLRQGGCGISHQHVCVLAEHSVDRGDIQVDPLGVDHAVVDVFETQLGAPAAGNFTISGEKSLEMRRPPRRRRGGRKPVSPGRLQLEHRVARLWRQLGDQPGAHRRQASSRFRTPPLPAGRHRLPGLEARAAVRPRRSSLER